MTAAEPSRAFRVASALGAIGLLLWVVFWFSTIKYMDLPLGERMWLTFPVFGADFWSQSAYAADLWLGGGDPYASRVHLLPYAPIVIRLFAWVGYFSLNTSVRIWTVVLAVIVTAGAIVAHRSRRQLGLLMPPLSISLVVILWSYPVLFELERGNCDLITVATLLAALPLLRRGGRTADVVAGALLSLGPWVKFYPGLLGLGLLALRRWWAVLGFILGGAAIFLSMPLETLRAFEVLGILMGRTRALSLAGPFPPWSHSLSHAWLLFAHGMSREHGISFFTRIPELAVVGAAAVGAVAPVCWRVFKRRDRDALTYPLLLWVCAVASVAPIIANDYSLVFYPLCVVACADPRDSRWARYGILASLLTWQPFLLPITGWGALVSKLAGLAGVGVSLWQRAGAGAGGDVGVGMEAKGAEEPSGAR